MIRLPGDHVPNIKNRSSKHLLWLTGIKPVWRSMSNAALSEYACKEAVRERARRAKKREKKESKI